MLKIGITGGIGSGKTTVAKVFEVLGIPVYYADSAAKKIMNEDEEVKNSILYYFGKDAYLQGRLNREYLAGIVFNNEEKLALLNSIVHPATIKDAANWIKLQKTPYVLKEAALMFESGANKSLNYIIGVKAQLELRIKRAIKRDNITQQEVMARIKKQMNEKMKLGLCDFIVDNNEEKLVIPQVLILHEKFLKLSSQSA